VATLLPPGDGDAAVLVEQAGPGLLRFVASGPIGAGPDRDLELWVLPTGAARPVSLGVLPHAGRVVPVAWHGAARLLVSREPMGGSPTGQPTGPVVYQGTLASRAD
jgi:anti-sigma-K factor RskA